MQEFEKHEKLKQHILRMASTGSVGSPSYWDDFISDLNETLSSIERAVLAKAIPKQEPVAYGIYAENGNIRVWWRNQFDDEAVCNSKAKEWCEANGVDFSSAVSLYDQPQPAQAAAIPEIATEEMCEALEQCLIDQGWDSDYVGEIDKARCWAVMLEAASPKPE